MNKNPENAQPSEGEKKSKPGRWRNLPRWAKILVGILAVLVVLLGAVVLYVNGKLDLIHYNDGTVDSVGTIGADEDQDLDGTGLEHNDDAMEMPEGSPFADDDVLNILLISTDERTDAVNDWDAFTHLNELDGTSATTEFSDDARADSLILVSLNIKENTIKLVSIERGTGVPIMLDGYEGQYDWITHTFRYGGAKLTMETVEDCFNVQVDHYVRINFNSFVQIVDAVGGVDINLTELEAAAMNWEVPSNSMLIVNPVHEGLNHMDGYTALQYARLRKIDNDWQRIARQRTVIQAVLDQIQNASVTELDNLLNTVLPLVQTNFTKTEIAALLIQLPGFLGVQAEQLSLPAEGTYGVRTGMDDRLMYDPDWAENIRILQRFLYGSVSDDDMKGYYEDNTHGVTLDEPLADEDFGTGGYSVYLAGQNPGEERNTEMKEALVRYLSQNQGMGTVLEDCGFGAGLFLNDFLQNGNEDSLQSYLQTLDPDQAEEAETFWRWAYDYNWSMGGILQVYGIGPDTDLSTGIRALSLLLNPNGDLPEEYQELVAQLAAGDQAGLDALQQALEDHFYRARNIFGSENWPYAKQLIHNLTRADEGADAADAVMMDNFTFLQEQDPEAVFFGQMDAGRVLQSDCAYGGYAQGYNRFGMRLQAADSPVTGKVCTILALYPDSGETTEGLAEETPLSDYWPDALVQDSIVSLDGVATPYDTDNGFLTQEAESKSALSYFQKIFVITDGVMTEEEAASLAAKEEAAESDSEAADSGEETDATAEAHASVEGAFEEEDGGE